MYDRPDVEPGRMPDHVRALVKPITSRQPNGSSLKDGVAGLCYCEIGQLFCRKKELFAMALDPVFLKPFGMLVLKEGQIRRCPGGSVDMWRLPCCIVLESARPRTAGSDAQQRLRKAFSLQPRYNDDPQADIIDTLAIRDSRLWSMIHVGKIAA